MFSPYCKVVVDDGLVGFIVGLMSMVSLAMKTEEELIL